MKANSLLLILLSPLFQFFHRLRQRKIPVEIFRLTTRYSRIKRGGVSGVVVCGIASSSYVAQIRFAYSYHIGIFRQSQTPTVLTLFKLMFHP